MTTYTATHASTVYRIHVVETHENFRDSTFILAETGWDSGHGEWIQIDVGSIAWSYIAEKMPLLAKREGDRVGWTMAFALAGIEVFE
jgi:hypothetical protein